MEDKQMETYENIKEFDNSKLCYSKVIDLLNYEECKSILLTYLDIDTLKKKYAEDKYFNNIYHHSTHRQSPIHHERTGIPTGEWDSIGYEMLHNYKAQIVFKNISLSTLTGISKEVARRVVQEG